jgi:uncharacterized protein (TIGR03083 family)
MSEWNFFDVASKPNLLRTVAEQSEAMLAMASAPGAWEAPTAAGHWQVRDVVGHLVDTTEGYFAGWEVATSGGTAPEPLGVRTMNEHVDAGARALRDVPQEELLDRLRADRDRMMGMFEALDEDQWSNFLVPHKYMGPLPACFYPVAQLVDYAVHSWDISEGTGRAHVLDGDAADLLVPFCFIVWQSTALCDDLDPFTIGIRVSGNNAGDTKASVSAEGITLEPDDLSGVPTVLEFDAASFVLTAMGRVNGGTRRGDAALADRFTNLFFRI